MDLGWCCLAVPPAHLCCQFSPKPLISWELQNSEKVEKDKGEKECLEKMIIIHNLESWRKTIFSKVCPISACSALYFKYCSRVFFIRKYYHRMKREEISMLSQTTLSEIIMLHTFKYFCTYIFIQQYHLFIRWMFLEHPLCASHFIGY